ncbi:MAG: DUF1622 domain-containing protein [Rhodobacteraceae bacterium]|nr:DUF1622 domain-containing protein [Paracoccaceae bacterium]
MADAPLIPAFDSLLHEAFPGLVSAFDVIAAVVSVLSLAVMLIGVARFALRFGAAELAGEGRGARIDAARVELGRYILAGLELLIVADIIHTTLSLTLWNLLFLALLVMIRSVISYFLLHELDALERAGTGHKAG